MQSVDQAIPVKFGVPGLAGWRQIEQELRDRHAAADHRQIDYARYQCLHARVRRFGVSISEFNVCWYAPRESFPSFEHWGAHSGEGPGDMLRDIMRHELAAYFYWDEQGGLRQVTGEWLYQSLSVKPESRFKPGDLARVVDPARECHCAPARGRMVQVVRPAKSGPLVLVDVPAWGVVGIDPELLEPIQESAEAAA